MFTSEGLQFSYSRLLDWTDCFCDRKWLALFTTSQQCKQSVFKFLGRCNQVGLREKRSDYCFLEILLAVAYDQQSSTIVGKLILEINK